MTEEGGRAGSQGCQRLRAAGAGPACGRGLAGRSWMPVPATRRRVRGPRGAGAELDADGEPLAPPAGQQWEGPLRAPAEPLEEGPFVWCVHFGVAP